MKNVLIFAAGAAVGTGLFVFLKGEEKCCKFIAQTAAEKLADGIKGFFGNEDKA